MKFRYYLKKLLALYLSCLLASCGLDSCLYQTECKTTETETLSCDSLSTSLVRRYSEESMNALEAENFDTAIKLLDCLITNDATDHKNYARRGLAYIGRTGRYAPTTLLLNLSDPTFMTTLQNELTSLQPTDLTDVDTLYEVGENLILGSSDILTAITLSSGSSSYQTIKWLAILYSGIGAAYIINSHKLFDAPQQLSTSLIEKIDQTRAADVKSRLATVYQTSLDYANDSDSVSAGIAVATAAILLALDYPAYLVNISISGEQQGFIDYLQQ